MRPRAARNPLAGREVCRYMTLSAVLAPFDQPCRKILPCVTSGRACRYFNAPSASRGRTVRSLPLGAEGVLDAALPRPLEPTFYARFRDTPIGLVALAGLAIVLWRRLRAP